MVKYMQFLLSVHVRKGAGVARESIPSDSTKWLIRQVLSLGVPLEHVLAGVDLTPSWLADADALVSPERYMKIVGNALRCTGDRALGLTIGPKQYPVDLGMLGYAMISGPTLRDVNEAALAFWELNGSLVTLSFAESGRHGTWKISPAFPMCAPEVWVFAVEELISTFHKAVRFISDQDFRFAEIHLSYPDPGHGALYRELFECPVFFGRPEDLVHVDVSYLDRHTLTGNPHMAEVCRRQCSDLLEKLKRNDELLDSVREIIVSSLGEAPQLSEVAARLAMSPRTLRRRLQERNTTYKHIVDEVRSELAKEYLSTTGLSVDQIAGRIGFTEATTFRRAFKKWTGLNIREFRKSSSAKCGGPPG
jgi:AraC-like DNA-binding protein